MPQWQRYTVAKFQDLDCQVQELLLSNYLSLDGTNWLTSFVVDITLNLLNVQKTFQIVPTDVSTIVFSQDTYSDYFIQRFKITATRLAMPILVNGNHYCLVIIDIGKKSISFFDPLGTDMNMTVLYKNKFINFMQVYNKHNNSGKINCDNLQPLVYDHLIQTDGYNCGPLIIYFFDKIINKENPSAFCKIDNYRNNIKHLILENSTNMRPKCLFCSRETSATNHKIECIFCLRFIHYECLKLDDDPFIKNEMCNNCRNY